MNLKPDLLSTTIPFRVLPLLIALFLHVFDYVPSGSFHVGSFKTLHESVLISSSSQNPDLESDLFPLTSPSIFPLPSIQDQRPDSETAGKPLTFSLFLTITPIGSIVWGGIARRKSR